MAKPEFLQFLAPIAALGATALSGGLGAPLLGAEAAAGGVAEGAAEAAPFLIPGTDTALAGAEALPSFSLAGLGGAQGAGAPAAGLAGAAEAGTAGLLGAEGLPGAAAGLADTAATAAPAAAPLATTPAITGPIDTGAVTALSSSPTSAASSAPALGSGISATSDLTAAPTLTGPPAGATVNTFATEPLSTDAPPSLTVGGPNISGGTAGASLMGADASGLPPDIANIAGFGPGAGASGLPPDIANIAGFGPGQAPTGDIGSKIGDYATKAGDYALSHPGALLTTGILGSQLLKGNPAYPAEATLGAQGASNAGTAASLIAPLNTGILPPGAKQFVDQGEKAAEATTRSAYGNLGLSGSTMEADAIGAAKERAAAQQFQIADQLLQQGGQFSSLASNDYNSVLQAQMARDKNYQTALTNFARALGGAGYVPPAAAAGG